MAPRVYGQRVAGGYPSKGELTPEKVASRVSRTRLPGAGQPVLQPAQNWQVGRFKVSVVPHGGVGAGIPATTRRGLRPLRPLGERSFEELLEGPYVAAARLLDKRSLCKLDAVCRRMRALNNSAEGPWQQLGCLRFGAVELDGEGAFEAGAALRSGVWKERYTRFGCELPTFRRPYVGRAIASIAQQDEVVYFRCMFPADAKPLDRGIYLEVDVTANPDNLSMALVDFEGGGTSSVTFSPDTGAVIRERKVTELPRKVKGSYTQALPATPPNCCFRGSIGIFLCGGHLAFLRRRTDGLPSSRAWESTGFITDLSWAAGHRLTPCLAFRERGAYGVKVARLATKPPIACDRIDVTPASVKWTDLDWDAEIDGA